MEVSTFPDEILLRIFSHLNYDEIKFVVPLVCRRWETLSGDVCLGSSYIVEDPEQDIIVGEKYKNLIDKLTQEGPNLKCLILKRKLTCDVNNFVVALATMCPNLEILRIVSSNEVTETNINFLIERCPKIFRLTLHSACLCNSINLAQLRHLKHLKFKGPTFIFDQKCNAVLCYIVDKCRELVEINVKYSKWRNETFKYVVNNCPGSKLVGLGLDVDHDCDSLKLLSSCTSLENLTLGIREVPKNEDAWLNLWTDMEKLRYLKVYNSHEIAIETFDKMILMCPFRNLQVLKLGRFSSGSDYSLEVIAHQFPFLRELALYECLNVTDDGLTHLFSKCSQLETVKLSFLGQKVRGMCLEDLTQRLKLLKVLKVCACDEVPRELVETLGKDNPQIFLCLTEKALHWQTGRPIYFQNIMRVGTTQWEYSTISKEIQEKYPHSASVGR